MRRASRLAWQSCRHDFEQPRQNTTILPNGGDVVTAREARSEALGDLKPASTLIVGGLANPAWKIEIEGIAVA